MPKNNQVNLVNDAFLNKLLRCHYEQDGVEFISVQDQGRHICQIVLNVPDYYQEILNVSGDSKEDAETKARDYFSQLIALLRSSQQCKVDIIEIIKNPANNIKPGIVERLDKDGRAMYSGIILWHQKGKDPQVLIIHNTETSDANFIFDEMRMRIKLIREP